MKETVNQRFNKAVTYLLETKRANNKKQIAESLEVSPSYFTEILKERLKLSGDLLQIFLNKWQVNPNFIFSASEVILVETIGEYEDVASAKEPFQGYKPQDERQKPLTTKPFVTESASRGQIPMVTIETQPDYLSQRKNPEYIQALPIYTIPKLSSSIIRAFEVDGNSMSPTLTHEDVIFAEWIESFNEILDDVVYVIVSKKDGILIRRVNNRNQENNYIITKADSFTNKRQYPDMKIQLSDIVELWKAKLCLNKNFTNPQSVWERITSLEAAVENLRNQNKV